MKPHWLTVRAESEGPAEILIQGTIGKNWWDDSGTSEKEFTDALKAIPENKAIVIGINSEGGSIQDGLGIYNAIKRRRENVTCRVDGYAVSIASVIALGGHRTLSPKSSVWMIHEPWSVTQGSADDHRRSAEMLDKHAETLAAIYAEETKYTVEEARAAMRNETWFKGEDAVAKGFADALTDDAVALNSLDPTRFKAMPTWAISRPDTNAEPGGAAGAKTETTPTVMPDTTPAAANPPAAPPATTDLTPLLNELRALRQEITTINKPTAAEPLSVSPRASVTKQGLKDILADKKRGRERFEFLRDNWNQLADSGIPLVYGANTDSASGALTVTLLAEGVVTVLQNQLAPLTAFTRNFSTDRIIGRNVIEVPKVTAGGTAQSNPTSFEDTTNFVATVANIAITPAHIVSGAHITNAELQNGWRMAWWAEVKASEFADKIQSLVNAIITTTNFTATPKVAAWANFGPSDLKELRGQLKKSRIKNIILDGEYFSQFIPGNMQDWNPLSGNIYPGWNGFFENTYWTGATTNTVGFACNPQAIGIGAGLPPQPPNMIGAGNLAEELITIPGIGLSVASYTWFATSSRTGWWTIDAMFGAAAGDTTAGVLIKSS